MIFDTDILISLQRGNRQAAGLLGKTRDKHISIQTYLELLQDAQNKNQHNVIKKLIEEGRFIILPFTPNIGHRALIYIEEFAITSGLRAGDAIIAATAVENNLALATANYKHFKCIRDLTIKRFNPVPL